MSLWTVIGRDGVFPEKISRSGRGNQPEAEAVEFSGNRKNLGFIAVVNADKNGAAFRKLISGCRLGFGKCNAEGISRSP